MPSEPSAASKLGREGSQSDLDNQRRVIPTDSLDERSCLAAKVSLAVEAVELAWGWLCWFDGADNHPEVPLIEVKAMLDELKGVST